MRLLTLSALTLGLAAVTQAQNPAQNPAALNPVRPMPAPINANPFGNILYPGGVPSFPTALGANVGGVVPYTGVRPGAPGLHRPFGGRQNTVVVPYAVPVYYGNPYYDSYNGNPYAAPQTPNVTVVVPQQPNPPVIINQTFTTGEATKSEWREYSGATPTESGGLRVYEGGQRSEAVQPQQRREIPQVPAPASSQSAPAPMRSYARDDKATIFLIAMKDSTIRQAIGYWVDGNTLNYVTPDASVNRISLDMVDRDLSIRLNAERQLDFDLKSR